MRTYLDLAPRLDAGHCAITGSTAVTGSPDTPAPVRRVQLLRSVRAPVLVAETWSDEAGVWAFNRIAARPGYTVIAYDDSGTFDPVAKANLIPAPMPPDPAEHP